MTEPTAAAYMGWWGGRLEPDLVAREVVGPGGIADLVGVRFDSAAVAKRRDAGISPLTDALALRAVLAIRTGCRSTSDLAEKFRMSHSGVRRAVRLALDHGAIVETDGRLTSHRAWRPAAERMVAVELKLHNWRRALDQALQYQRWANAVWVVMATPPGDAARHAAVDAGLGLGWLTEEGEINVLRRPRPQRHRARCNWAPAWAGEQALAAAA